MTWLYDDMTSQLVVHPYYGFESQIGSFFRSAKEKKGDKYNFAFQLFCKTQARKYAHGNNIQDVQCLNKILKYIKYSILSC